MTSLLKRFAGLLGARGFTMGANIVALLLVARWVGPNSFASLAVSQSLLTTVAGLATLGIPLFALRAAALGHDLAVGFALAINLVSTAIIAISGFLLAAVSDSLSALYIIPLALSIALDKNQEVRIGLGMEFGAGRLISSMIMLRGAVLIIAVVVTAISSLDPITVYVAARFIGSSIAAFVMYVKINRWPIRWRRPRDGTLASLGGFMATDIFGAIRNLDVWIVSVVGGPLNAGLYGAVNRISTPILLFAGSLRTVIMGSAARSDTHTKRRAIRLIMIACLVLLIPATLLAVFSRVIVMVILGGEYTGATGALAWFLIAVPALTCAPLISTLLQASGMAAKVSWNTCSWNIALLACIACGVMFLGATGAALAFSLVSWGKFTALLLIAQHAFILDKGEITNESPGTNHLASDS